MTAKPPTSVKGVSGAGGKDLGDLFQKYSERSFPFRKGSLLGKKKKSPKLKKHPRAVIFESVSRRGA